eukprot:ANDGO_00041.mRNA.1 hypothetical protein ABB37_10147
MLVVSRNGNIYTCQDLTSLRTNDLHVSRLKPYDMTSTEDALQIASVDSDEYVVESIVEHRGKSKRDFEFRVRWSGYNADDDSWLPYSEVRELEALETYLSDRPSIKL